MQGTWEGKAVFAKKWNDFTAEIDEKEIIFTKASTWPELDGKRFSLIKEGDLSTYIETALGKLYIEPHYSSPDVLVFGADVFSGWLQERLLVYRKIDKRKK